MLIKNKTKFSLHLPQAWRKIKPPCWVGRSEYLCVSKLASILQKLDDEIDKLQEANSEEVEKLKKEYIYSDKLSEEENKKLYLHAEILTLVEGGVGIGQVAVKSGLISKITTKAKSAWSWVKGIFTGKNKLKNIVTKWADNMLDVVDDVVKKADGAITNTTNGSVIQPVNNIDELYEMANNAKSKFDNTLDELANMTNSNAIKVPLKDKQTAIEKLVREPTEILNPNQLKDILRGTLEFDNFDNLEKSLTQISKKFDIVKIKNKFQNPNKNGYADLNILVKEKGNTNGIVSEIQVHWKPLLEIKKQEDILYKQIRSMADSNPQKTILEEKSKSLYKTFWENHLDVAKKFPNIWNLFFN